MYVEVTDCIEARHGITPQRPTNTLVAYSYLLYQAAIGIWLIGQPGWRKLDVIVLGRKYTFAAEHEATLERWHEAISARMPHLPVEALCKVQGPSPIPSRSSRPSVNPKSGPSFGPKPSPKPSPNPSSNPSLSPNPKPIPHQARSTAGRSAGTAWAGSAMRRDLSSSGYGDRSRRCAASCRRRSYGAS